MNDLMAEARDDAATPIGAPPGLKDMPASPAVQGASGAPHKIDVQSLFNGIPAAPPGLKLPVRPQPAARDLAEQGTVALLPSESDMRSMLPPVPEVSIEESVAPDCETEIMKSQLDVAPEEGLDQAAEDLLLLSSSQSGRPVGVGSVLNDGGIDDAATTFPLEDMPLSLEAQETPRTSSAPPSSPRASIWGPGLDAGATGSTITSTDWTQMQEIWNREPVSKSQEAAKRRPISEAFNREQLTGSTSTPATGMTHSHASLGDALSYGRHSNVVEVPAYAAAQGTQHVGVSDSMRALASMSLLPVPNTRADKQIHHDSRQPTVASHGTQLQHIYGPGNGTQVQPNYGTPNMTRRQPQPVQHRQAGHMVAQPQGASEDPHSFEIYLKQLVANAQQQQQQQFSEQQRVQAAIGPRATHASSVMHPRGQPYHQAPVSNQVCHMI